MLCAVSQTRCFKIETYLGPRYLHAILIITYTAAGFVFCLFIANCNTKTNIKRSSKMTMTFDQ